jgi:hypothetical protein
MKHLSAFLALALLLTVGLGCSDSGETSAAGGENKANNAKTTESAGITVDYVTMKDSEDETVQSFKPTDRSQKISVQFSQTNVGKVRGVFTAVNAGGAENYKLMDKEIEIGMLMNQASFTVSLDRDFPAGDYKLDVYVGGKLIKTHNYKVQ